MREGRKSFVLRARLLFVTQAALAIIGSAATVRSENNAPTVSKHDLQAKIDYCETCHGIAGRGFHGYYPIPRLAGQPTEYIEDQLQAFAEHRRKNVIMFSVAHVLSPEMETALANYFAGQTPPPAEHTQQSLVPEGKKIYDEGVSASDIPPCASCHGPDGKGNGQFPRLAGQLPDYIFNKLTNFSKERGQDPEKPDASAIMQPIAHALTESQIRAVAAYVGSLD